MSACIDHLFRFRGSGRRNGIEHHGHPQAAPKGTNLWTGLKVRLGGTSLGSYISYCFYQK